MSNPKALIGEIRRLAAAVGKVRADNGKTSRALDRLASALDEWRDEVVEAERVLGEVGDLCAELHGGDAWRPVWHQPEARKAADFRYMMLSALRLRHDDTEEAMIDEVRRLQGAYVRPEVKP